MKTLSFLLLLVFSASGFAQNPPAVLNNADIDRFIKTFKPISDEFSAIPELNEEDDDEEMFIDYTTTLNSMRELLEYDQAISILKKYGWEPNTYPQKMLAIVAGTTYSILQKNLAEMPAEQAQAFRQLYGDQFKNLVNEADLKLINSRLDELEAFFNEMEEDEEY